MQAGFARGQRTSYRRLCHTVVYFIRHFLSGLIFVVACQLCHDRQT
jgi:hypothetical protein